MSNIPANSSVTCAALRVYEINAENGQTIHVHRITSSWLEAQTTWNERWTGQGWGTVGGDYVAVDNPGNDEGVLLRSTTATANQNDVQFEGDEDANPPQLVIDYVPTLSINDVTVTEGDSGSTNAVFTVTLAYTSSNTVTVDYATADNTATTSDNDYVTATDTLTFTSGITQQTIIVTVNGDLKHEGNEIFFVNLSNSTNAAIADGQGIGTINNDEVGGMMILSGDKIFLPLIFKSASR